MWTRAELKARAWEKAGKYYWMTVLVSFISGFFGGGGSYSGSRAVRSTQNVYDPRVIGAIFSIFLIVMAIAIVIACFVAYPLEVGCKKYFLRTCEDDSKIDHVGFAFSNSYLNVVKVMFLTNLSIFLWSLLFIIPGIIKAYEYMMVPYILSENPTLSAEEAKNLSSRMMDGEKFDAFVLGLSFIGWNILSLITFGLLSLFWVNPYFNLTFAELYRAVRVKVQIPGTVDVVDANA